MVRPPCTGWLTYPYTQGMHISLDTLSRSLIERTFRVFFTNMFFRRHYVRFPPGVLDRHYEKLLQNDPRLLELSRKGFPSHDSPYFNWAPYEYRLSYSFDPLAHQVNPQINFRMTDPREQCLPHGLIHQPIQTHQRAYDLAIPFDDSTVSPISGTRQHS